MTLDFYLQYYHPGISKNDLEVSDVRGYWKLKKPCPGGEQCRHAFRGELGPCKGGGELVISFSQRDRDARGRFLRPYREWESWQNQKGVN